MATFADRLRYLRKENNMTQQELADKFFITKSAVSKYENGVNTPENRLLQDLADCFKVSVDYLLGRTDQRNYKADEIYPNIEQTAERFKMLRDEFKKSSDNQEAINKAIAIANAFKKKGIDINTVPLKEIESIIEMYLIAKNIKKD